MPHPKVKISDDSGNTVAVDTSGASNALKVSLLATPTIDIGDVSLLLGGTAADTGAGVYGAQTLRVTMAANDALLTTMNTNLTDIETLSGTIAGDTTEIAGYFLASGSSYAQRKGIVNIVLRTDALEAIPAGVADGDYTELQVDSVGGLYVTGSEIENAAVQSEPLLIGGRYDSSARTLDDGDAGAVALNASGHVIMDVVDGGQLDTIIDTLETTLTAIETDQAAIEVLLTGIDADTNTIQGNIVNIGNATYSDDADWTDGSSKHLLVGGLYQSSMQSVTDGDVAPFQVDANGVLKVSPSTGSEFQVDIVSSAALTVDLGSNNDVTVTSGSVGHDITGLASDDNDTVGTSAEKISGADGDVACKRVDIMAHPDNTGYIWVGDSAVSVDGLNGGIRLSPGDFYSMDIDNTGDIYVIATVDTENVCFNYFT